MLDAFIIDRIQRERETPSHARVPLHIEVPLPPPPSVERPLPSVDEHGAERGVVEVDFTI